MLGFYYIRLSSPHTPKKKSLIIKIQIGNKGSLLQIQDKTPKAIGTCFINISKFNKLNIYIYIYIEEEGII